MSVKGYVVVDQWHSLAKTWDELANPEKHTGDAAQVDKILPFYTPKLSERPLYPSIGEVCLAVHEDGHLSVHAANYDSSG